MTLTQAYVERAVAAMSKVDEVSYRRIFTGAGIYHRGVQFAFIVNDRLYFRADVYSRPLFEHKYMPVFQPRGSNQIESSFYQLPGDILDNPRELKYWMRIAVEAAHNGDFLDDETTLAAPVRHMHIR